MIYFVVHVFLSFIQLGFQIKKVGMTVLLFCFASMLIPCMSMSLSVLSNDSIVRHRIDPFHYDNYSWIIHNDSLYERDEQDGLVFRILSDSTVEFFDYKSDTIIIDSLVIPSSVSISSRFYTVIEIAPYCLSRQYYDLQFQPYNMESDITMFGPSYLFIPSTVRYISDVAFFDNINLKTVVLNEGLEEIGENAFSGSGITGIEIPRSVSKIASYVFVNCHNLDRISVNPENKVYDSRENCNGIIESSTDYMFVTGGRTTFPASVRKIFVGNQMDRIRLGKNSKCERLSVSCPPPKVIDVRRCKSLRGLSVSYNHSIKNRRIFLPSGINYLHTVGIDIKKIKGKILSTGIMDIQSSFLFDIITYDPEIKQLTIIRKEQPERFDYSIPLDQENIHNLLFE